MEKSAYINYFVVKVIVFWYPAKEIKESLYNVDVFYVMI